MDDTAQSHTTGWIPITDAPHSIEVEWGAAPTSYTFKPDSTGGCPGSLQLHGNKERGCFPLIVLKQVNPP
jgi:hypothetical protein